MRLSSDRDIAGVRRLVLLAGTLAALLVICLAAQPGVSPIFRAVENRDKSLLDQTLKNPGAEINSAYFGRTPLHLAVVNSRHDLVNMLIESGADVSARDQYGNTPLHLAAFCHRRQMARVLLSKGASVNARNGQGSTPLHVAVFVKAPLDVTQVLIDGGADPDLPDNRGRSALDLARERAPAHLGQLPARPESRSHAPVE